MTRDEALSQKLAAVEVLMYLSKHGSTSLAMLRQEFPALDETSLIRGIVLAHSAGGLICSVEKTRLGAVKDFQIVEVCGKRNDVLKLINRQIFKSYAS